MIELIKPEWIKFNSSIQGLCSRPYYKHGKGCPNYGKPDCPPNLPLINEVLDFNNEIFVIYTEFNVGAFAQRMKLSHPDWSLRQLYNPRLWQPTARKNQRFEEQKAKKLGIEFIVNNAEGNGVNYTSLMKHVGIELQWKWPPDQDLTYRISIGGKHGSKL